MYDCSVLSVKCVDVFIFVPAFACVITYPMIHLVMNHMIPSVLVYGNLQLQLESLDCDVKSRIGAHIVTNPTPSNVFLKNRDWGALLLDA